MEKLLKKALDDRGLKYDFIARHVGVSYGYFMNLLNGHADMPIETLIRILHVANIPFEEVQPDYDQWKNYYNLRND